MVKRKIVEIDEEKCDGCGLCIPNCHEGALQIVNGKAKLVADVYCDGLGNCLGECPQDAITIVEKDVDEFDFKATNEHLRKIGKEELKENPLGVQSGTDNQENTNEGDNMHHEHTVGHPNSMVGHPNSMSGSMTCGCPGSMVKDLRKENETSDVSDDASPGKAKSELRQWPIQLCLIPPNAGFLQGSDLLISADCVSAADANFQSRLLKGRSLIMGCPKLDDLESYKEKIKAIIELNDLNTITVAIMEVPCCASLYSAVEQALDETGKRITLKRVVLGIDGNPVKV